MVALGDPHSIVSNAGGRLKRRIVAVDAENDPAVPRDLARMAAAPERAVDANVPST